MIGLNFIYSEIFLSICIMFLLIVGVFKKNSSNLIYNLSIIALFLCLILLFSFPFGSEVNIFNESYKIDYLASLMKTFILVFGIFTLLISKKYIQIIKIFNIEYPVLILSSMLGMMVMISSNDLIIFYIGLELQSLALYVLASFNRDNILSSESGVKYFVLSALSSGLLLYGCSLIYGFSGSTNFNLIAQNINPSSYGLSFGIVFILVGLAFKISAVPFHMWAPDVYQGSPTSVTVFFALLPKVAAITVLIRFLYIPFINMIEQWQTIIIFLSIASMLLGSIAAIGQKNLKRLIAYSSIGHMGYALAGVATGSSSGYASSVIYMTIYITMNIGAFGCIFLMKKDGKYSEEISDLSGISKNKPLLAISLLIILFSLAGVPPLAGFFAKFYIFMSVIENEMYLLAIIGLVTTVISAFYYLKIIKIIYFDELKKPFDSLKSYKIIAPIFISCLILTTFFLYPSVLNEIVVQLF